MMNPQELMKDFDELEQLVENSPGFFGKRLVDEEAFFTQMLIIRRKFAAAEEAKTKRGNNTKSPSSPWSNPNQS